MRFEWDDSKHESRQWLLGMSPKRRVLQVVFTERSGSAIRIITAWKANQMECELYESEKRQD
jgi:uncharacterized DUF497 family protein